MQACEDVMRVPAIIAGLGLTLLASACAPIVESHGNAVEEEDLARVVPGQTGRAEVRQILGTPTSVSTFDDNLWYYTGETTHTTAFFAPDVVQRDIYEIRFGEDGKVADITHVDQTAASEVEPVERTTVTRGRRYTLFEQMVSTFLRRQP
jgi:outer membrane protein assembly factor BamE (lipoprotein component of BamABCDE complex)